MKQQYMPFMLGMFMWALSPSADPMQDEGGASRDEIAAALVEVAEGRIPKDRIALRELYREIMGWPFVDAAPEGEDDGTSTSSPYEAITPTGVEGIILTLRSARAALSWLYTKEIVQAATAEGQGCEVLAASLGGGAYLAALTALASVAQRAEVVLGSWCEGAQKMCSMI